jgi:hypothetical protein
VCWDAKGKYTLTRHPRITSIVVPLVIRQSVAFTVDLYRHFGAGAVEIQNVGT